jgi:hypothetical protein
MARVCPAQIHVVFLFNGRGTLLLKILDQAFVVG